MGCRPSKSAKQKLKSKLRAVTSRKRAGTFDQIVTEINQIITGWINYFGIAFMKVFIKETQQWLNRRLRQLIWKRWKSPRTRYKKLRKLGISHEHAKQLSNSRKGYWKTALNHTIHNAISLQKLKEWGLKDMNVLYQIRYSRG